MPKQLGDLLQAAPALSARVAAVCRSRWAWTVPNPARRAARATMQLKLLGAIAVNGAYARTNTARDEVSGRPWRR